MMKKVFLTGVIVAGCLLAVSASGQGFVSETHQTSAGDLKISFPGHATVFFEFGGKTVWVDPTMPYVILADNLPKADLILICHEHDDHLNAEGIETVRTPKTQIVYTAACARKLPGGKIMKNGEKATILGFPIEAVPAYNLDEPYHPKGVGNGYVLTFGNLRVYVAGDTENVPEVKALKNIDIAILPLMTPFTMSEEMLADAAKAIKPKVLYVYHSRTEDYSKLKSLLKDSGIDLRVK